MIKPRNNDPISPAWGDLADKLRDFNPDPFSGPGAAEAWKQLERSLKDFDISFDDLADKLKDLDFDLSFAES